MTALSMLGFGAFVLASFAVGARLLLLARRTRLAPETAIGLAFFVGGGVGYLLVMLSTGVRVLSGGAAAAALLVGSTCLALGAVALAAGIRAIFRPGDARALAFVTAAAAVLAVSIAGRCLDPMRMPSAPWVFWISNVASSAVYAWSALESVQYAAALRRRARVGLADAWIANRFALWGVSASAIVAMHAVGMAGRAHYGDVPTPAWLIATASLLGIVAAASVWLAFFPPRRVRSLVQLS